MAELQAILARRRLLNREYSEEEDEEEDHGSYKLPDAISPRSVNDDSSDASPSFLDEVHALTSLLSGIRDIAESRDDDESSFVGYIGGVHSLTNNNHGEEERVGVQTNVMEYGCSVTTSQSTEGTRVMSDSSYLSVKDNKLAKASKKGERNETKGIKSRVLSSVRRRLSRSSKKAKK